MSVRLCSVRIPGIWPHRRDPRHELLAGIMDCYCVVHVFARRVVTTGDPTPHLAIGDDDGDRPVFGGLDEAVLFGTQLAGQIYPHSLGSNVKAVPLGGAVAQLGIWFWIAAEIDGVPWELRDLALRVAGCIPRRIWLRFAELRPGVWEHRPVDDYGCPDQTKDASGV